MTTTRVKIEPQIRVHTKLAEDIADFKNMIDVGFSVDDLGKYHTKGQLVRMLIWYMSKRDEEQANQLNFAEFEEVINE